jgi:16S rRNA (cytidine1402-2'-O)-methyltransferase
LATEPRTAVFFESPHRIAATLADAAEVLGADRQAAVCRELTKTYEEVRRGGLGELAEWAAEGVRGEITVVLAPATPVTTELPALVEQVQVRVDAGERLKTVVAEIASAAGVSKKELYDASLKD